MFPVFFISCSQYLLLLFFFLHSIRFHSCIPYSLSCASLIISFSSLFFVFFPSLNQFSFIFQYSLSHASLNISFSSFFLILNQFSFMLKVHLSLLLSSAPFLLPSLPITSRLTLNSFTSSFYSTSTSASPPNTSLISNFPPPATFKTPRTFSHIQVTTLKHPPIEPFTPYTLVIHAEGKIYLHLLIPSLHVSVSTSLLTF